jgi:hypothetical protein
MSLDDERFPGDTPGVSVRSVLETLPPVHAISCSYCGKSFALRSRLTQSIQIRCADCGRLFQAQANSPEPAGKAGPLKPSRQVPERGLPGRARKSAPLSAAVIRRRLAAVAGFVLCAFLLGLQWPSMFPGNPHHQWDIEVGLPGGKKATFALYGRAEDRIEFVYSSFDEGPVSSNSGWTCYRDEARMLAEDEAKGRFPIGVGFHRAEVPWEIRFCGEGRARVESAGKVFPGTIVRSNPHP